MHLINLIGGSGSGKGLLAEKIIGILGAENVETIPYDMYYYPADRWPSHLYVELDGKQYKNFDTPEALETSLLIEHIKQLKNGQSVQIPHYDFGNNPTGQSMRTPGKIIQPKKYIILDGLFGLCNEELRALTDISIFIDISPLNRMARRFIRDFGYGQTRAYMGSGLGDTMRFYLEYVERGYQEYVEKYKLFADLVVNNDTWVKKDEEPRMVGIATNYLLGKFHARVVELIPEDFTGEKTEKISESLSNVV